MRHYLDFVRRSWPLLAFGFCSVFWGNFGQSFYLSWYGAPIQESLGLSAGRYGSLYSLATLGSGLLILAVGGAIDRWPLRRFTAAAALGLCGACLALANASNAGLLLLGFFLVRLCGQGLLPHTAQTTMARYFDHHRGKALSLSASGVPVGEVVLPLLAVGLISTLGWANSWLAIGTATLLLYLPFALWLLRRAPLDADDPALAHSGSVESLGRREMLRDVRFWLALPGVLAAPFLITGVFIHQNFILAEKDWTAAWLATCFIVSGIVHWCGSMITGLLIDRFSARHLLRVMLLPLVAAMLCLALLEGQWVAALFMALIGLTMGTVNPVTGALWAEVYGTARLGSIRALMSSLMVLSTAAAPFLFGVLIDAGLPLPALFGGAGVLTAMAAVLLLFSYRPPEA